ncbi:MAG: sigma 54-interacting transcriptional regulator [Planctomycetota bacterium]
MARIGGIVGLLLALAGGARAEEREAPIPCPTAEIAPRIDGLADDAAWQDAAPSTLGRVEQIHPEYRSAWTGPEDLSGVVRAVRTPTDLYLLFEVTDDVLMHEPGQRFWNGDSIEVFLDADRVTDPDDERYSDDDRQLFVMPFNPGVTWSVVSRGPGLPYPSGGLSGIEIAHQVTESGYTVELRIPLATVTPLLPDADGTIGFDVALNDVDRRGVTSTDTYMTLSGRQDLYADPTRFGRLAIGPAPPAKPLDDESPGTALPFAPSRIAWALVGVAALSLLVRAAARRLSGRPRRALLGVCGASVAIAALVAFIPSIATSLDQRQAPERWAQEIESIRAAAQGCLDLDSGPPERRAARLLGLVRDGAVRTQPRYRYDLLPLTPETNRRSPVYKIALESGESRTFPMLDRPAPRALELRLDVGKSDVRGSGEATLARVLVEFEDGPPVVANIEEGAVRPARIDLGARAGDPMRSVTITSLLSFHGFSIDSLAEASDGDAGTRTLPLATYTPRGTPIDIWRGRPASHILNLAHGQMRSVAVGGKTGHRLWLVGRPIGAYPDTPYGVDAVTVRVHYRGDAPGPALILRNGIDLKDASLLFAMSEQERWKIALAWSQSGLVPGAFTVHSLALDPAREVERIEVRELGVLSGYRLAAATLGRRDAAAPSSDSSLLLEGERLTVRPEVREKWKPLHFAVVSPVGRRHGDRPGAGVDVGVPLQFGPDAAGSLVVEMPGAAWTRAIEARSDAFFAVAAIGLAFATVLAGAALLGRARHLRVKMLFAVGTAAVVPLLFLVVTLTAELNEAAEKELEAATAADQRSVRERVLRWRARVSERAALLRDSVEPVRPRGGAPLAALVKRQRENAHAEGLRIRLPGIDPPASTEFANTNAIDATRYSGLVSSPWDGVMALGVARAPGRRRYLVAAPSGVLLGQAPSPDVVGILYARDGSLLATTRGNPIELNTPERRAAMAALAEDLRQGGRDVYRPATRLFGERWAASFALLAEGGEPIGVLGVYRSRAATESSKAAVLRTLLFSGLAALLLVVLAGSMLVEGVTTRLQRVTSAAGSIAEGDLESRVPIEAEDEVGQLARSFNAMANALDHRVGQLSQLHHGLQELATALDRDEAAKIAGGFLARASGARHVVVAAYDRTTERLETLFRSGDPAPVGDQLPRAGPERRAIAEEEPQRAGGGVFLPLIAADRVVGLAVCRPVDDEIDLDFLDASARQIGIALENARLYRAAATDDLTGLYSMGFLRRRLGEEVDGAASAGRKLSLLRVGVANHTDIARAHGARAAARVVAESAELLARDLPARAVAARHEAGEFVALLVDSDAEEARRRLTRVRATLDRHEFAWLDGLHHPAFHHGQVTYPDDGSSAEMLLDKLFESAETSGAVPIPGELALRVPEHLTVTLGTSASMRSALAMVARVGPTNATVLLSGETGVGKEVMADLVQANSTRADGAYVKVNCAAIPETLIESELFGHEKGAFTGADRRRIGRFEEADGGTLFLDEIGDLRPAMQVKLLRILQERRFTRVGGTGPIEVDVRIIAATNRDLAEAVREGAFREDLFHRLHVIEIVVPPLRERRDDLPHLLEQFRMEFNRRHGLDVTSFRPDALDALYHHRWPGNVRELRNVVERAMLFCGGTEVEPQHLSMLPTTEEESTPARRTGGTVHGLTPRQERILDAARRSGGLTNREVVASENVSARTALRELQTLVERGLLSRVGRRRGAVYKPEA